MGSLFTLFASGSCGEPTFFGLYPWYHYLNAAGKLDSACNMTSFTPLGGVGQQSDILLIGLAVVDDLLRVAGVVAVGYVIYAGIKYVISQGSPEEVTKAKSTLLNALLGLAIAMVAVAFISFIGNKVGGASVGSSPSGNLNVGALPNTQANQDLVNTVLSIVFGIVGAIALLFITIGGFRYVMSQGDPQGVEKAKSTILYAVIGLIVAILAQVIVSFVIGKTA